jgi:hypothetical protein
MGIVGRWLGRWRAKLGRRLAKVVVLLATILTTLLITLSAPPLSKVMPVPIQSSVSTEVYSYA